MPYHHFTASERGQIQVLFNQGESRRVIARALRRSPSTISRELARNGVPRQSYDADAAQRRYHRERQYCRRTRSLDHGPLRSYVFDKMVEGYSPEQVAGRLWLDFPGQSFMRVSHETIYRTLYSDPKFGAPLIGCLRRRRPRRYKRGQRRPIGPFIPNRIGIEMRPTEVELLGRYGDWEGDLVIGAGQDGAILTLVERKSLFLRAALLRGRRAHHVAQAVIRALKSFASSWLRTLTLDNGSEFAHHQTITKTLGIEVYFAHPYAAYERGRNENTNGLLRQYFPKTLRFSRLEHLQLQSAITELNNRPRKTLGYRTPYEVLKSQIDALAV